MSRIKIIDFGPLNTSTETNGGWLEIRKVTVFVGNQGSGKSTIAKLISTCVWPAISVTQKLFFNRYSIPTSRKPLKIFKTD